MEATGTAVYGPFTPPSGFTLAAWEPIASNDAHLTTEHTNRQYVWWGHATLAGAQDYEVLATQGTGFYYADTVVITVKGYTTPFADTTSTATYSDGDAAALFPSVSVTPSAADTGFLWFGTSWTVGLYGYPAGYTDVLHDDTLSVSSLAQGAPATQTVAPSITSPSNLLTAALMTFR